MFRTKFAAEIAAALGKGMDYAEVSESGDRIHFCRIVGASTPMGWSWGPNCPQFWI